MPGRGGGDFKRSRRGEPRPPKVGGSADQAAVDESSPVIQLFRQCQTELDARHDKYERIVKLSRDITIDSKRTIFLLHRITREDRENILEDAAGKLEAIKQTKWKAVATELHGCDPYRFVRAYSPGLQEYIEAASFYHYLKEQDLVSLEHLETQLQFTMHPNTDESPKDQIPGDTSVETPGEGSVSEDNTAATTALVTQSADIVLNISVHIPPIEYMLGVADLTGELMRMAIQSVGNGNLDVPYEHCKFLRTIHDAFVSYGNVSRELVRKVTVLRQSLRKVETACYTLQVRGSEIPQHMLADVFSGADSAGAGGGAGYEPDYADYD